MNATVLTPEEPHYHLQDITQHLLQQQLKLLSTWSTSTIWSFALAPHINQILHLAQGGFVPFPACLATCTFQHQSQTYL